MRYSKGHKEANRDGKRAVAIAAAHDFSVIEAVKEALNENKAHFLLVGPEEEIKSLLIQANIDILHPSITIMHADTKEECVELSIKLIHEGEAHVLMKGNVPTATLLKGVLHKEWGLRSSSVLSHVALFTISGWNRPIFVTDAAMNIAPDLMQKKQIIENAVKAAIAYGVELPKVAVLAAVETVNPSMQACLDAAALTQMNKRGQIKDCVVDGPLALDNAISAEAAAHKQIVGDVAGQATVLVVPDIEAGNILYKSLVYFAGASVAGILMGASVPIVLTSRADSASNKVRSLTFALQVADNTKH